MCLLAVAACLALPIAGEIRAAGTGSRTDTVGQQNVEAAKKADADLRRDAAGRLITLRRLIPDGCSSCAVADKTLPVPSGPRPINPATS